jgi:hypothetical protein
VWKERQAARAARNGRHEATLATAAAAT